MGEQIKNMMVGLLMLAACAFTVALILFLKPSVGDEKKTYQVYFSDINGINVGTRVMFAGKPVGEVVKIQEIKDARSQPSDFLGKLYFYRLTLKVDSSVTLYNTDKVTIQTSGLLGEKSIGIVPQAPKSGVIPRAVKKETIYAESADPLEIAFYTVSKLALSMEGTFDYIHEWLQKNGDNMSHAISSFSDTMKQADAALEQFNRSGIIEHTDQTVATFADISSRVRDGIKELQDRRFFSHLSDVIDNVDQVTHSLASAKGTLGRLIEKDDMYLQFTSLLTKAETLMNDVNHYGLLFHLNKSWQRERLQQITLLNSLDSPAAFKSYFENEVQEVNLAMSRLSMLLDRAQQMSQEEEIFRNPRFSEEFASFLREVDNLADNVKLYNEKLTEIRCRTPQEASCP